jgi:RNA polymerase sigma-70 factor (ECF subfamily)
MAILADRGLAEDAVHQAFMRLLARGGSAGLKSVKAFLITVVRNEAYRLVARRPLGDTRDRPGLLEPADETAADEQRQELDAAMEKLTAEQREVVHLKVWQKMTFAEIGELLKVPQNTAASRYRYAIERLRELLPAAKE